ncbi:MAG TPA: helix-turn-helix domain-containing protein [Spirochaetes bacterium]|nr:helix-turn-helix domain-containing protein [Spirochaetota bacterium]
MTNKIQDYRIPTWSFVSGEILYDQEINDAAFRVYAAISGLCGSSGCCYASNAWFTEKLGKDKTTISRAISRLEKSGFILTTVINVPKKGSRRFIFTFNLKQLRKLAQVTEVGGSAETAEVLSGMARMLLEKMMVGVGKNDNPPMGDNEEGPLSKNDQDPIGDNAHHRIKDIEKERESEKDPPSRSFKKGPKNKKSLEEVCWDNYLMVKAKFGTTLDPEFYDFFEKEVLGRFPKQEVYAATLSDWYNDVWGKYATDDIIAVLKRQRDESNAWQVKWHQIKNRLEANIRAKKARQATEDFREGQVQRDQEQAEKIKDRRKERLEFARKKPDEFNLKYRNNPMFKIMVDSEPELAEYIQEVAV